MAADLSFERAIAFAGDLIRIPSAPGHEEEVAKRVQTELERLGFHDAWTDEVGNVIGRIRGTGEGPAVMLSCHLDVVDPGDEAAWEHPPYGGTTEGGYLHGRGAMDIKGPLALQTYAAARFAGQPLPGDIIVAHTVLEERGGLGMEHLMDAGEVRPDAVIIGEATGGDICVGHRGRAELLVRIHGEAGHASAPNRARNALDPVGDVLAALRDFSENLELDPILGRSTLVATGLSVLPESRNVIPDQATVVLDWRVLPGVTPENAAARVRTWLADRVRLKEGFTLDVLHATEVQETWPGGRHDRRLFTPGFLISADHPIAQAAAGVVREHTGRDPEVRPWTFATDGGHTCGVHGVPTIGLAPGEERHAHTNRERLELGSAQRIYEAYPDVIRAVQEALR